MNKSTDTNKQSLCVVLLMVFLYALQSCNNVSEEKINSAVLENEKKYFSDKNDQLESIKVDSLRYVLVSEKKMMLARATPEIEILNNHINYASVILRFPPSLSSTVDSSQTDVQHQVAEDKQKIEALQYLIDNADSVNQSIYKVDYFLDYKKDGKSYYEDRTLYLKADNLKEYNPKEDFKKNQ